MSTLFIVGLGDIVVTQGATKAIPPDDAARGLTRHSRGDWGDLDQFDADQNNIALHSGGRLLSAYHTDTGVKFYIITEADRRVTTILLPEEY